LAPSPRARVPSSGSRHHRALARESQRDGCDRIPRAHVARPAHPLQPRTPRAGGHRPISRGTLGRVPPPEGCWRPVRTASSPFEGVSRRVRWSAEISRCWYRWPAPGSFPPRRGDSLPRGGRRGPVPGRPHARAPPDARALERVAGVIVGQFTEMKRGTATARSASTRCSRPTSVRSAFRWRMAFRSGIWTTSGRCRLRAARLDAGRGEVTLLDHPSPDGHPVLTRHLLDGVLADLHRRAHQRPRASPPAVLVVHGFKASRTGDVPSRRGAPGTAGSRGVVQPQWQRRGRGRPARLADRFGHATYSGISKTATRRRGARRGESGLAPTSVLGVLGIRGRGRGDPVRRGAADVRALVTGPQYRKCIAAGSAGRVAPRGRIDIRNARTGDVLPLYSDVLEDILATGRRSTSRRRARVNVPWLLVHGLPMSRYCWPKRRPCARRHRQSGLAVSPDRRRRPHLRATTDVRHSAGAGNSPGRVGEVDGAAPVGPHACGPFRCRPPPPVH